MKKLMLLLTALIGFNYPIYASEALNSPNVSVSHQNSSDGDDISLGDESETSTNKVEVDEDVSLSDLLNMNISSGSFLDLDLSKSPISLTIITKKQINLSGARNISELLEIYTPGFQYMYNKWNGTLWGMRGVANDRNTKIIYLINGHKINSQARDGFVAEQVLGLLGDIKRVEVLRGPAGLVYGSGAIAGIINVITQDPSNATSNVTASYGSNNTKEVEGNIYNSIDEKTSVGINVGYKSSDGLKTHQAILYGKQSWPYPSWLSSEDLVKRGVPSDGNYGATPGNYKAAINVKKDRFSLYARYTRQVEEAGGWFPIDLWPEVIGTPDSTSGSKTLNNPYHTISADFDDPFYSADESWGTNRREYINDNAFLNLEYSIPLNKNELRLSGAVDAASSLISTEMRPGYYNEYDNSRLPSVDEEFGEKRISVGATYMLKSIDKLQLAVGTDFRLDLFGNSFNGLNAKGGNIKHPIITDTSYTNIALFSEGYYELNDMVGFDVGLRFDKHTRANMLNGKFATILSPNSNNYIKLIIQSSSNNGSVDNYEYNRWHFDNNGQVSTSPSFERPYQQPTQNTDVLPSFPSIDVLHNLKPERVLNYEITSTHNIGQYITVAPAITYGQVKDLFGWNQTLFRVVNVGSYNYLNADLFANFKNKIFDIGVGHTYQRPINTDVANQSKEFYIDKVDKSAPGWYDSTMVDGKWMYTPVSTGKDTVVVNLVKDAITNDGKNFINLATNLSKFYIDFSPFSWLTLHSDIRIFWGLPGREFTYKTDESDGFQYWNIWKQSWATSIKKVDLSAYFNLTNGWNVGLYAYNVLGLDRGIDSRDQKDVFKANPINALRWQQMAEPAQVGMVSSDQRAYSIKITKNF